MTMRNEESLSERARRTQAQADAQVGAGTGVFGPGGVLAEGNPVSSFLRVLEGISQENQARSAPSIVSAPRTPLPGPLGSVGATAQQQEAQGLARLGVLPPQGLAPQAAQTTTPPTQPSDIPFGGLGGTVEGPGFTGPTAGNTQRGGDETGPEPFDLFLDGSITTPADASAVGDAIASGIFSEDDLRGFFEAAQAGQFGPQQEAQFRIRIQAEIDRVLSTLPEGAEEAEINAALLSRVGPLNDMLDRLIDISLNANFLPLFQQLFPNLDLTNLNLSGVPLFSLLGAIGNITAQNRPQAPQLPLRVQSL